MNKLAFALALVAGLTTAGCVSMGGGSSDESSAASTTSLSDSGRTGSKLSDSEIVSAINDAYKQDQQLAGAGINVTANQGTVTLSGNVPSAQVYNRAISVARSVTGRPPIASNLNF